MLWSRHRRRALRTSSQPWRGGPWTSRGGGQSGPSPFPEAVAFVHANKPTMAENPNLSVLGLQCEMPSMVQQFSLLQYTRSSVSKRLLIRTTMVSAMSAYLTVDDRTIGAHPR
jgi:hypothetical protein